MLPPRVGLRLTTQTRKQALFILNDPPPSLTRQSRFQYPCWLPTERVLKDRKTLFFTVLLFQKEKISPQDNSLAPRTSHEILLIKAFSATVRKEFENCTGQSHIYSTVVGLQPPTADVKLNSCEIIVWAQLWSAANHQETRNKGSGKLKSQKQYFCATAPFVNKNKMFTSVLKT